MGEKERRGSKLQEKIDRSGVNVGCVGTAGEIREHGQRGAGQGAGTVEKVKKNKLCALCNFI